MHPRRALLSVVGVLLWACSADESAPSAGGGAGGTSGSDAGPVDAADEGPAPPYAVTAFDRVRISGNPAKPSFQKATASIDWGAGPFEKATLVADLDTTCFPFEGWKDNPPPAGENWPADCDAFDRNFEFLLRPAGEPRGRGETLELVRAITPFGGPLHLEVDVTDVLNGIRGSWDLVAVIGSWYDPSGQVSGSDGGWYVSARLELTPGPAPRNVLLVRSLFDGSVTKPDPMAPISFEVPEGTTATRLEYRVTGHGGVVGAPGCGFQPAEEFCERTHELFVDGSSIATLTPWRDDCADLCTLSHFGPDGGGFDYCQQNPCGAIASVKAPRANWCPGSVTPPILIEAPSLTVPGTHDFRWELSGLAEGGSWRTSATFFAFGP